MVETALLNACICNYITPADYSLTDYHFYRTYIKQRLSGERRRLYSRPRSRPLLLKNWRSSVSVIKLNGSLLPISWWKLYNIHFTNLNWILCDKLPVLLGWKALNLQYRLQNFLYAFLPFVFFLKWQEKWLSFWRKAIFLWVYVKQGVPTSLTDSLF